ncbi:MAG: hypothetical protein ACYC35_10210 [Pirellulales bacterium]
MNSKTVLCNAIAGTVVLLLAGAAGADTPAPPVNQSIGMEDILIGNLTEAECRACHSSGVSYRHHLLCGDPVPPGSKAPYPDGDGNGMPDATYGCLNCHGSTFTVQSNCIVCHTTSPHHTTPAAEARHCKSCHGSIVDDYDDLHYVPTYAPSIVTPKRSVGDGLPLNSLGGGAGACDYCHDDDGLASPVIRDNHDLHHGVKFANFSTKCLWCHDAKPPASYTVRQCERCHGPTSLHNIQADSPRTPGTIVVGGEDAGYGHVGRDVAPGDSDCWGCHGFAMAASAPGTGPLIPALYGPDRAVITAGTDTVVVLAGAALTNTAGDVNYEADVALTAADGTSVTLQPDMIVNEGMLAVTIPGNTAPGNYSLRALKAEFKSNPAVVSIIPPVTIARATWSLDKRVTITGSGFGGYAAGSGTAVTGEVSNGIRTKSVTGEVVAWDSGRIVVTFPLIPSAVTVKSVFGGAKSAVGKR